MLRILVSSLLFIKKDSFLEVFSEDVQKLWNEWELRFLVFFSLLLQVILIFFGSRRKFSASNWVRVILWLSYLSADAVAITALGALSHSQGQTAARSSSSSSSNSNSSSELMALWAPFLLLHLGGPDTITAYSLEDNELWMRHFLGLLQQFGIAVYVTVRSWAYSRVSILTVFMFIPGIVKYGERTWVLRFASKENFRDSMLGPPEAGLNYAKFMNDYDSKQAKGSRVTVARIEDFQLQMDDDNPDGQRDEAQQKPDSSHSTAEGNESHLPDDKVLLIAYKSFEKFKLLFVDLILSADEWKTSREIFQDSSSTTAFKVIEMELGFTYDLLYSKAPLVYSPAGLVLRCITFSSIITLLVAFITGGNHYYLHHHMEVDIFITYILFIGAFILEIYAIFILISSDRAFLWLSKPNAHTIPRLVSKLTKKRLSSRKRWSNSVAQYNFISVCVNDKRKPPKILLVDKLVEKYYYKYSKEVLFKSKELIFKELKRKSKKVEKIEDVKNLCASRGDGVLGNNSHLREKLQWSLNDVEFDQSILLWHIATDLCYECDNNISPFAELHRQTSKLLSDYMLYLLIMCPFMLPEGIGQIRFRDTREEAERFFKETNSKFDKIKACEKLLEVNTEIRPVEVKGDQSKSVLFDACRLAKTLQSFEGEKFDKWEIMCHVWIEMMSYAANQCRGTNHAQQLRQGGEFITHVWLLMAHLGIAQLFQISQGHVRAMLISG
ncbi:uncharacterized protein LOC122070933 [Macadamia integrifolia]|uniref:uncharacterized protein LOC122070933 n=1 Tax=Macadamia integrifolia TaxID=60698 RepID=UPI001C4F9E87|nr:uncharacterized protein LOC122070933 [Macadamia integrifolia]